MGNYLDFESDFVKRTIRLIEQYNQLVDELPFEDQLNYTLTINCLLGLIVMPKERVISYIPNDVITTEYKQNKFGFIDSTIGNGINRVGDFIHQLRNSIAHFAIEVESTNEQYLVDYLIFNAPNGNEIARIKATEIVPFLKFYSSILLKNLQRRSDL